MDASDCGALQNYLGADTQHLLFAYSHADDTFRNELRRRVEALQWPSSDGIRKAVDAPSRP